MVSSDSICCTSPPNPLPVHPSALVFDPDRFLDDRLRKYLLPNPFIFLPFNAGPRICLGQQVSLFRPRLINGSDPVTKAFPQFAYNEMSLFLIRLLQTFSGISFAPDADPDSLPPASWATGEARRPIERVWLKAHLTLYANVSPAPRHLGFPAPYVVYQNGSWLRMKKAENGVVDG